MENIKKYEKKIKSTMGSFKDAVEEIRLALTSDGLDDKEIEELRSYEVIGEGSFKTVRRIGDVALCEYPLKLRKGYLSCKEYMVGHVSDIPERGIYISEELKEYAIARYLSGYFERFLRKEGEFNVHFPKTGDIAMNREKNILFYLQEYSGVSIRDLKDLKDLEREEILKEITLQILSFLLVLEKERINHEDMHTCNILFIEGMPYFAEKPEYISYEIGDKTYYLPFRNKILKVVDYGMATKEGLKSMEFVHNPFSRCVDMVYFLVRLHSLVKYCYGKDSKFLEDAIRGLSPDFPEIHNLYSMRTFSLRMRFTMTKSLRDILYLFEEFREEKTNSMPFCRIK